MSSAKKRLQRVTTKSLVEMKNNGEKSPCLRPMISPWQNCRFCWYWCYPCWRFNCLDGGTWNDFTITLDQMIYHASSVVRAIERSLVVVDLPFGSYQSDPKEALRSSIRIMKWRTRKTWRWKEIKESIKNIKWNSCNGTFRPNTTIHL
jgi:3-methyl-2-oxobutanoate hydroxymethyltransferase